MRRSLCCAVLSALCAVAGCGGGGGGGTSNTVAQPITISVPDSNATLPINGSETFTANVTNTNNTAVTWSIQEGSAGGTVTPAGVYKAPAAAGTYHVVATSEADTIDSVIITVVVQVIVSISPPSANLAFGQSQTFTANVLGSTNVGVSWSIQEGSVGGTIGVTSGVYMPPSTPGTYHVVATSTYDQAQSAPAAITVQGGSASGTVQ